MSHLSRKKLIEMLALDTHRHSMLTSVNRSNKVLSNPWPTLSSSADVVKVGGSCKGSPIMISLLLWKRTIGTSVNGSINCDDSSRSTSGKVDVPNISNAVAMQVVPGKTLSCTDVARYICIATYLQLEQFALEQHFHFSGIFEWWWQYIPHPAQNFADHPASARVPWVLCIITVNTLIARYTVLSSTFIAGKFCLSCVR